jgi:hypothetical protein
LSYSDYSGILLIFSETADFNLMGLLRPFVHAACHEQRHLREGKKIKLIEL